jgi:hypothetical protein
MSKRRESEEDFMTSLVIILPRSLHRSSGLRSQLPLERKGDVLRRGGNEDFLGEHRLGSISMETIDRASMETPFPTLQTSGFRFV